MISILLSDTEHTEIQNTEEEKYKTQNTEIQKIIVHRQVWRDD